MRKTPLELALFDFLRSRRQRAKKVQRGVIRGHHL
jgi:hypothetical protein